MSSILFAKHVSFEHSVSSPRPVITSRREEKNNKAKVFQHPIDSHSQSASSCLISPHFAAGAVGVGGGAASFLATKSTGTVLIPRLMTHIAGHEFATRLKEQAELCGFGDPDEQIRDQLVASDQLRKKFLDVEKLLCRKPWRWLVNLRPRRQRRDVCPPHQPPQDSKATRCVVWVDRNNTSDNGRQPSRSRRSLARDVDNRATTSRFCHAQREATYAVDVQGALRQLLSEQTDERRIRQELDFFKTAIERLTIDTKYCGLAPGR